MFISFRVLQVFILFISSCINSACTRLVLNLFGCLSQEGVPAFTVPQPEEAMLALEESASKLNVSWDDHEMVFLLIVCIVLECRTYESSHLIFAIQRLSLSYASGC